MSFLSQFNQAKPIIKPWKCCSCNRRFKQKAHAVNHQRQTSSLSCRAMGFCLADEPTADPESIEVVEPIQDRVDVVRDEVEESVLSADSMERIMSGEDRIDFVDNEGHIAGTELPDVQCGLEDEKLGLFMKEQRMSRKGTMKSTPFKISRCLRRMEELARQDDSLSQRSLSTKVAEEFSTNWRNCYRWRYE